MAQEIASVPKEAQGFDGSQIKGLVENESNFNKYVDKTFNSLDTHHKGTLSKQELMPIMEHFGEALGLPPHGTDKDSDHIYDEVDTQGLVPCPYHVFCSSFGAVLVLS